MARRDAAAQGCLVLNQNMQIADRTTRKAGYTVAMHRTGMTGNLLRWTLAIVLAALPSLCRCHLALHSHDHADGATVHHHAHATDEHGESCDHHHGLLSGLLCDHEEHDCECPKLVAAMHKADEQSATLTLTLPIATLADAATPTALNSQRAFTCPPGHVPRPQMTLLRLHCALIV